MAYPYPSPQPSYYGGYQSPQQRIQAYEQQMMQQQQQYQQQQQVNSGIVWVQGSEGAKSYMIPPNSTVLLMDSEGTRFYIKSTDMSGMPSLRTFQFQEIVGGVTAQYPQNTAKPEVSREEFDALKNKVQQYESLLAMLTEPTGNMKEEVTSRNEKSSA